MKVSTDVYGGIRKVVIDGKSYEYGSRYTIDSNEDKFLYTLPHGETFTHPTREGCLLMILKHAGGNKWTPMDENKEMDNASHNG